MKMNEKIKAIIEASLASAEVSAGAVAKADQYQANYGGKSHIFCGSQYNADFGSRKNYKEFRVCLAFNYLCPTSVTKLCSCNALHSNHFLIVCYCKQVFSTVYCR
jgi:hypothetical protein